MRACRALPLWLPMVALLLGLRADAQQPSGGIWPDGVVVVKGSTVSARALPPILPLLNGDQNLDGIDLYFAFIELRFADEDLLAWDIATRGTSVLDSTGRSALERLELILYRGSAASLDLTPSGSIDELLATTGNVLLAGLPFENFVRSGQGGGGGGGGGGCTGADSDGDGRVNVCDNCPTVSNASQTDSNGDGLGDACEVAIQWTAPEATSMSWMVTESEGEFSFSGPIVGSFANACLAVRSLGGSPVVVIDSASFTVNIVIQGPAPPSCSSLSDPVQGIAGKLGALAQGDWTLLFESQGESVSFAVPEPGLLWLQLAALASIAWLSRRRRPPKSPSHGSAHRLPRRSQL